MILRALKRGRIDYFRKKLIWVKVIVRVTQKSLKEKKSVFVSHKFPISHLGKLDINKDKSIAMPIVRIILPLLGPRTIPKAHSLLHMAIVCA